MFTTNTRTDDGHMAITKVLHHEQFVFTYRHIYKLPEAVNNKDWTKHYTKDKKEDKLKKLAFQFYANVNLSTSRKLSQK